MSERAQFVLVMVAVLIGITAIAPLIGRFLYFGGARGNAEAVRRKSTVGALVIIWIVWLGLTLAFAPTIHG
jgi:hypothetical protein